MKDAIPCEEQVPVENERRDLSRDASLLRQRRGRKSVTVRVAGGMGNQMFSYAAARRLALVNGADLLVDPISGFTFDYTYRRTYILDRFSIEGAVASRRRCFCFSGGRLCRLLLRRASRRLPGNWRPFIEDQYNSCFEKWFMDVRPRGSVWVEGHFQSANYFQDIEAVVRREFRISKPLCPTAQAEQNQIRSTEQSVALGIRLYQEVPRPGTHLVLDRGYYLRAAAVMHAQLRKAHYFIFCNDHDWVRGQLRWPYPHTVIEPRPRNEDAWQDLCLMSACEHFIIPNSTFHWWGAWLAANPARLVVAPDRGFQNIDTIPETWQKLAVE